MSDRKGRCARALRAGLLCTVALTLASPTLADGDPALEQLLREMRELQLRQAQLEAELERLRGLEAVSKGGTLLPENVVTGGERPNTFVLPGTNTEVRIGGYIKGDLMYNVDADVGDTFDVGSIPPAGSLAASREGSFRAHAKQTRVNISTWTPSGLGEVHTFVEGDFFGAGGNEVFSNSTTFRLRHAFGQVGPLLVGQTWTLFMPLASYPETVDFFGPQGMPFVRQGQIRYTHQLTPYLSVAASAENSEFTGRAYDGSTVGSRSTGDLRFAIDSLPDFVGAIMWDDDRVNARLSGVVRRLELDHMGLQDSTTGWGLHASAAIKTFGDDSLQLNFTWGDGIGRYLINGFAQDAFVTADGRLETIESWGLAIGYTRVWNEYFRSNLVWGRQEFRDTFFMEDTKRLDSIHVNLIWSPVEKVDLGIELIYGRRAFVDSTLNNSARRVQAGARYSF